MSIKEDFIYKKLRKVPEPRLPLKDYVSGLYDILVPINPYSKC